MRKPFSSVVTLVTLVVGVFGITSGCQKNETEAVPAQRIIEQTEADLQALKTEKLCDTTVVETKVGAELKTYQVSIKCKNPDTYDGLKKLSERLSTTRSYIESRRGASSASPSQIDLLNRYMDALAQAAQGVNSEIDAYNNAAQDPQLLAAIARLEKVGCKYSERQAYVDRIQVRVSIQCADTKSIALAENQLNEVIETTNLLNSKIHKKRLVALDTDETQLEVRIEGLKMIESKSLPSLIADLQNRFKVNIRGSIRVSPTEIDLANVASIKDFAGSSEAYELVVFLKSILTPDPKDSPLYGRDLEVIAMNLNTCNYADRKTLYLCSNHGAASYLEGLKSVKMK